MTTVDLDGWIATGGAALAPLKDRATFLRAEVGAHGAAVTWDGDAGDLAIDAHHLMMIATEQQPFTADDLASWQAGLGVSNRECAGLFDLSPSTWATYKAGTAPIPQPIRMLCRTILRDPLPMHAFLHAAREPGRPRRETPSA